MNLAINVVIEWLGDRFHARVERVLFIDPSGTDMVTIDIDPEHKKALPIWRKCEEVSIALAAGDARLLDSDPYEQPAQTLSNRSRKHRDEIWDIIKPLIEDENEEDWSRAFWCTRSNARACHTVIARLPPNGHKNGASEKPH
jgi:hypothetical protein